jgi:hypothetical protein
VPVGVVLCQPAVPQATLQQQLADPDDSVRHRTVLSVLNGLSPSQRTAELDGSVSRRVCLNVRTAFASGLREGHPGQTFSRAARTLLVRFPIWHPDVSAFGIGQLEVVSLIFTSWNQTVGWLRSVDSLRHVA